MDMEKKLAKHKTYVRKFILDNYKFNILNVTQEIGVKLNMAVSYCPNGVVATGVLMDTGGEEMPFDFLYKWDEIVSEEITGTFTLTEILDMLRSLQLFHKLITGDIEIEEIINVNVEAVSRMTDEFQAEFGIPTMALTYREIKSDSYTRENLNYCR